MAFHFPCRRSHASSDFRLYALINHEGSYAGGHYEAVCYHQKCQRWYLFDDSTVRLLPEDADIVNNNNYILLFRKIRQASSSEHLSEMLPSTTTLVRKNATITPIKPPTPIKPSKYFKTC
ncbi:ubiquitin carboxyl-terminal hydrolase [Gregarina niphandrodes]|uniref:Ubiquitin carboxyl-terminal hydrolase n=1 Tax=Gregarina niphandrodes TaxID=110365 RepID=A0A023B7P2_GRENI|nr:ubiquitin carboxyl-terminal hydrolase [Gregarina niphandrodes]EZG67579.1 ubiquitin carboxyl-terminal hydrolase [Gregarina niphandrodes]|eukprot:XP_011130195.1 ubiquitin carboxyl-terminal hydrolase [Gregarina niphandrodes]